MKKKKTKKSFLKKAPKLDVVKSISSKELLKQMALEQGRLVKEVENPYKDPEQDNRSLFFRETFKAEKRRAFGGLL